MIALLTILAAQAVTAAPPAPPASIPASIPATAAMSDGGLPGIGDINTALDAAPIVRQAAALLDAAKAHARVLAAGPHEFQATGGYIRRRVGGARGATDAGQYDEFDATVLKPFRLPGKAALDRRAGGFEVKAALNRLADARHQAALTLASAWYDLLAASEMVGIATQLVTTQTRTLDAVRLQVRYQDAAVLDADRAEVELGNAQAELARVQGQLAEARAVLGGAYPGLPSATLAPRVELMAVDAATLAQWRERVLGDSHELRAAQADADRAHALAARARLDRFADPSIGARAFSERGGNEVGLGVVAVIPFGGRFRRAAADQAAAEAGAADQALALVRRQIEVVADTDVAAVRSSNAVHDVSRRSVAAARTAVARLVEGRRLGGVNLADLLYAQRQARDAERAEAEARAMAARVVTKLRIDAHLLWALPESDETE